MDSTRRDHVKSEKLLEESFVTNSEETKVEAITKRQCSPSQRAPVTPKQDISSQITEDHHDMNQIGPGPDNHLRQARTSSTLDHSHKSEDDKHAAPKTPEGVNTFQVKEEQHNATQTRPGLDDKSNRSGSSSTLDHDYQSEDESGDDSENDSEDDSEDNSEDDSHAETLESASISSQDKEPAHKVPSKNLERRKGHLQKDEKARAPLKLEKESTAKSVPTPRATQVSSGLRSSKVAEKPTGFTSGQNPKTLKRSAEIDLGLESVRKAPASRLPDTKSKQASKKNAASQKIDRQEHKKPKLFVDLSSPPASGPSRPHAKTSSLVGTKTSKTSLNSIDAHDSERSAVSAAVEDFLAQDPLQWQPSNTALANMKVSLLQSMEEAVQRFFKAMVADEQKSSQRSAADCHSHALHLRSSLTSQPFSTLWKRILGALNEDAIQDKAAGLHLVMNEDMILSLLGAAVSEYALRDNNENQAAHPKVTLEPRTDFEREVSKYLYTHLRQKANHTTITKTTDFSPFARNIARDFSDALQPFFLANNLHASTTTIIRWHQDLVKIFESAISLKGKYGLRNRVHTILWPRSGQSFNPEMMVVAEQSRQAKGGKGIVKMSMFPRLLMKAVREEGEEEVEKDEVIFKATVILQ